jgi:DNA-binding protein HU-beta
MRKADLVSKVSESTGVPKVDVLVTVEAMFKEIRESLTAGENVYVRGFGSFVVKRRAQKVGRNILAETSVVIPEHYIPAFRPSKTFTDKVKRSVKSVASSKAKTAKRKNKKS